MQDYLKEKIDETTKYISDSTKRIDTYTKVIEVLRSDDKLKVDDVATLNEYMKDIYNNDVINNTTFEDNNIELLKKNMCKINGCIEYLNNTIQQLEYIEIE